MFLTYSSSMFLLIKTIPLSLGLARTYKDSVSRHIYRGLPGACVSSERSHRPLQQLVQYRLVLGQCFIPSLLKEPVWQLSTRRLSQTKTVTILMI